MVVSGDRLLCTETDKYTDIAYEYNEPPPEAVGRAQMDLLGTEEGQANVHKMLLIGDVSALSRSRRTARVFLTVFLKRVFQHAFCFFLLQRPHFFSLLQQHTLSSTAASLSFRLCPL